MGNPIPTSRREQVKAREQGRCLRCAGRGAEWHHRRTRRVFDSHQHCPCNGVWLCHDCHAWVHAHPLEAAHSGFWVSRHQAEPGTVQLIVPWGTVLLGCDGAYVDPIRDWIDHLKEE